MKKITDIICVTLLLFQGILIVLGYNKLPAEIPIHANLRGEIDSYGPKGMLVLFPLLSFGLFLLFQYASRHPEKLNYPFPIPAGKKHLVYARLQMLLDCLHLLTMIIMTYLLLTSMGYDYGNTV